MKRIVSHWSLVVGYWLVSSYCHSYSSKMKMDQFQPWQVTNLKCCQIEGSLAFLKEPSERRHAATVPVWVKLPGIARQSQQKPPSPSLFLSLTYLYMPVEVQSEAPPYKLETGTRWSSRKSAKRSVNSSELAVAPHMLGLSRAATPQNVGKLGVSGSVISKTSICSA